MIKWEKTRIMIPNNSYFYKNVSKNIISQIHKKTRLLQTVLMINYISHALTITGLTNPVDVLNQLNHRKLINQL